MTTKKCLVSFDIQTPHAQSSDFLIPVWDGDIPRFFAVNSKRFFSLGRVVFVGHELRVNDIFAKLVDSGRKIESVNQTLMELEAYIEMLKEQRIGSVLELRSDANAPAGFVLSQTGIKANASAKKRLP